jgi:hypothetical protein
MGLPFVIEPGVSYRASGKMYSNQSYAAIIRINWYDGNDAFITYNDIGYYIGTSAFKAFAGNFPAPSNARRARVSAHVDRTNAAGPVYIGDFAVNKRNAASLIVDGGITADSLAANAVTAGKIAANAVTAGTIAAGAVTASTIAAGAIATSKLIVTDLTNLVPNGDFEEGTTGWTMPSRPTLSAAGSIRSPAGTAERCGLFWTEGHSPTAASPSGAIEICLSRAAAPTRPLSTLPARAVQGFISASGGMTSTRRQSATSTSSETTMFRLIGRSTPDR